MSIKISSLASLAIVIAAEKCPAQTWEMFHPEDTSLFYIDSIVDIPNSVRKTEVIPLRFDSIISDSSENCYYAEPIVWRNEWMWIEKEDCLVPKAWIGEEVCYDGNMWTFKLSDEKSFVFSPFLQSQLIYYDSLQDSIVSELISIEWMKIAQSSTFDSVRIFKLHHFSLNDSGSFGVWNDFEIIISKNFGLVRFPMVHFFPELFASVELLAHRNISNNYQYWHYPGRFFLDMHDELAFKGYYQSSGAGYYVEYEFTEFWTVSAKESVNAGEDIRISFNVESQKLGYRVNTHEQQLNYIDKIEARAETRTFENIHGSLFLPRTMTLDTVPDSTYSVSSRLRLQPCWGYSAIGTSRPRLVLDSNCFVTEEFLEFDPTSSISGILGIGESYFYRNEALLQQVRESRHIVYIKSDSITCGTRPWPLSLSEYSENQPLQFYVSDDGSSLLVNYPVPRYYISLIGPTGQLLQEFAVQEKSTVVDISNLASGVYVLAIKSENAVETAKFVKR